LRIGNGLEPGVQVGPVVNEAQLDKIHRYVELGKAEGAKLLLGGERATEGELAKGYFYKPTLFVDVTPQMRIFREEIFGPVLSVVKAKDYDEAIKLANDTTYGLSSSIYTRDVNLAMRAIEDLEAGITYVNHGTIGAEIGRASTSTTPGGSRRPRGSSEPHNTTGAETNDERNAHNVVAPKTDGARAGVVQ